jgi:hypothetical protein
VGNYVLSGGSKNNWIEVSDYGFTLLYPPDANPWSTGLDEDNVFDFNGRYHASPEKGMFGFNIDGKEFGLIWVTPDEPLSFEEILDIHYFSGEVNALKRDRGFNLETEEMVYGEVNGHEAVFQSHVFELDMPDMDRLLFGKGVVAGWVCEETGVTYVSYIYYWNTGWPSLSSYSQIRRTLNNYLDTFDCH